MRTITARNAGLPHSGKALRKPSALTLLGHIIKSLFTGEALWIAAPGGALLAYLHVNRVTSDILLVLLLLAVVALAFLRGCKAWQRDLNSYRKTLTNSLRSRNPG